MSQNFATTLNVGGGINNSQTAGIVLTSVSGLNTSGGILCFDWAATLDTSAAEYIEYTGISGNSLTGVTRGVEGLSAKSHSNGAVIVAVVSKSHVNRINDKLTGVDTGVTLSSPALSGTVTGNGTIPEAVLSISDNTTKDVSTSAHGFVPKAPNDTTKFLRGDATWATTSSTFVGATVKRSTTFAVSTATWTDVQWDAEDFDTNTMHDNVTNPDRVTIAASQGGKYLVAFSVQFATNATGFRSGKIQINGADGSYPAHRAIANTAGDSIVLSGSGVITLAAGDIVRLQVHQTSGGNLNVNTDNSLLSVVKLG